MRVAPDETIMSFSPQTIETLAELARIALTDEERTQMAAELERVFLLLDRLQAAPTEGVEPLAHPLAQSQRLREDHVTEPDCRDALLALAPSSDAGLYLVPKVIDA